MYLNPPDIDFYKGRYAAHPHCPAAVLDFWTDELMLSRKHVVLMLDTAPDKLCRWLPKYVHLLCFATTEAPQIELINQLGDLPRNLSLLQYQQPQLPLDSDSIDFAIVSQNFQSQKHELQRVLRLNSYVCILLHNLSLSGNAFADAYAQLLRQYQITDDHQNLPHETQLKDFFDNHYSLHAFPNQLRFNADTWRLYIENAHAPRQWPEERRRLFARAARLLFQQHAQDGELVLECSTHVYTGLFNKNTPAISLRKSIFFQLLKPFAFAFYVLVKFNVYFWRMVYKLGYALRPKK